MRIVLFLFGAYLLAISVLPCSDLHYTDNCSQVNITAQQTHHNNPADVCSPFCSCTCCGVVMHTLATYSTPIGLKFYFTDKEQFLRNEFHFSSGFYGNIWQPPRANV